MGGAFPPLIYLRMKKIFSLLIVFFIAFFAHSQSTLYLRGDTIRMFKQADSSFAKADSFLIVTKQAFIGKNYTWQASTSLELGDTTRAIRLNKMYSRHNIVTPVNGMMIYEDSTNEFICYAAGAWGSCGGTSSTPGIDDVLAVEQPFTAHRKISGGGFNFTIDSAVVISLFSGLEFISSGIGSSIQMGDSVMNIGSSSVFDFTSITFSPTNIKFLPADGLGSAGNVWTNTGGGNGHWSAPSVQGADVASVAGAITLGNGDAFELTGTSAVTLISNAGRINGSEITLWFTSTASLTDGTANSGTDIGMELEANTNFTGSAGASITLQLIELGGTQRWRQKSRSVN